MTLRLRAILTLGLIEAVTLAAVAGISAAYLYHTGIEQLEIRARETAVLIRAAIGESLMIAHLPSVQEIVDAAFYDLPALDRIQVIDETGAELALKIRGHELQPGGHISMTEAIELGSIEFGKVIVCYSTASVTAQVRRRLLVLSSVSLLAVVVSMAVTAHYTTGMTAAIADLERGLRAINVGQAPHTAEYDKQNELGQLVASYNRLVTSLRG